MRILHVAESFGGGVFHIVANLANGQAARGHEVAIAYGNRPETPDDVRADIPQPTALYDLGWATRTPAAQARALRDLRGLRARLRPDVIHLHSSFAGAVGGLAAGDTPTVFSPHAFASTMAGEHGMVMRGAYRAIERFALRRATIVGATSEAEADTARSDYAVERVAVVHNGIPELDSGCAVEREPPERRRVIAMGRTVPQRQPQGCAQILSGIRDLAEVAWVGGGGGDRGTQGWAALRDAGIEPTGWVPRDRVQAELRSASAYLHWTAWDGHPLSVLEAMAADVPVVASDIPVNREILGAEQVCSSEGQAVALLRRLLTDLGEARRLRDEQRRRRTRFTVAAQVDGWLEVYDHLVRSSLVAAP